jgi:hypothetical protein
MDGKITFDKADFASVRADTTLVQPTYEECPEPLDMLPGTSVKTYVDSKLGEPPLCGRLSRLSEDGAVVVGYGWLDMPSETFVWRGTRDEYARTWVCD